MGATPAEEISAALSARYGFAFNATAKIMRGLDLVGGALNRGDIALAQIAALNLHFPDPPYRKKRNIPERHAAALCRSDVFRGQWDADSHPRWPAGDSSGRGGEFRPADAGPADDRPLVVPAQATVIDPLPVPWEMPWEVPTIPRPTEILPPPLDIPNEQERTRPPLVNPFPRKRKCVEEWDHATEYCEDQEKKGNFRPGYGGPGKDYYSCVMGQVSQECGGNGTEA
jgi:hypothetical protein